MRHVVDCRNYVKNKATGRIPHEDIFGTKSKNLAILQPFRCFLLYRPPSSKLTSFDYRGCDGLCLYYEDDGVYYVLADERIKRTKHVRARKQTFPGLSSFKRHEHRISNDESPTTTVPSRSLSNLKRTTLIRRDKDHRHQTSL